MGLKWKIAQQAEIRWWKNYLKGKDPLTYLTWKRNYWANFLKQINFHPASEAVCLDAGSGPAGIFIILDQSDVDAVDPLLDAYEKELNIFSKEKYSNVSFQTKGLEQIDANQKYDVIFCLNAINHVENIELAYDKLKKALKPKGTLVLSIDSHNYQFFKHLFRLFPGDILHPHQYDLKEYQSELTTRGFQIINSELIKKEFFFNYFAIVAKLENG